MQIGDGVKCLFPKLRKLVLAEGDLVKVKKRHRYCTQPRSTLRIKVILAKGIIVRLPARQNRAYLFHSLQVISKSNAQYFIMVRTNS